MLSLKIKENQAANTRHLVERITRAAYGMTFSELIKALGDKWGYETDLVAKAIVQGRGMV